MESTFHGISGHRKHQIPGSDADELLHMHGRYSFLHHLLESDSEYSSAHVKILSSMNDHCGHCRTSSDDVTWGCHDVSLLASLSHVPLSLHDTLMYSTGVDTRKIVDLNDALNESNLPACFIYPMLQQQASCSLFDSGWAHLPASSLAIKDKGPCLKLPRELRDDVTKANAANPIIVDSSSQIPVGIPRDIVFPFSPTKDRCGSSFTSEIATCSPPKLSHDYHVKLLGSTVMQADRVNSAYFSNNEGKPSKISADNKKALDAGTANTFMDLHEGNPSVFESHPTVPTIPPDVKGRCLRLRKCQTTNLRSLDERMRRQRISKALKAMHELLPSSENGNQISMLDDVIDYVKFLQLQTKVLSENRLLIDLPEDILVYLEGFGHFLRTEPESIDAIENIIDNLMESDMPAAIQLLQRKGLCLLPLSSADCFKNAS